MDSEVGRIWNILLYCCPIWNSISSKKKKEKSESEWIQSWLKFCENIFHAREVINSLVNEFFKVGRFSNYFY